MDTNIVPVTEAEMSGFFQRVVTNFVALSAQATELSKLQERFATMQAELDQLRNTNSRLLSERDNAIAKELENEQALGDARRSNDYLSARVSTLNEVIVARDAKVQEVEGILTSVRGELDSEQRAHEYTKGRVQHLETDLSLVRERRNHWQDRAEKAEAELAEVQAKLSKVIEQMTTMSDILGVLKQAPEQAKEAAPQADPSPASSTAGESGNVSSSTSPSAVSEPRPWWEQPISEQKVG